MLKAYASYFVSYLLDNINKKSLNNIRRIVLFGSVARDEATKNSDIDLFIETSNKSKTFENEIKKILEKFYQSRESSLFKTKGIDSKINIKSGVLKDWNEIYTTIASEGIVLYGYYEAKELPSGVKHFIIIFWDKIEKNRGAFLNKIYGFKIKEKRYEGLLSKFNGKKLGKSSILIPIQHIVKDISLSLNSQGQTG